MKLFSKVSTTQSDPQRELLYFYFQHHNYMTVLIKYLFVESFLAVCKKCKCDPLYSKWRKESFTQVDIADTESEVFMTYNNAWLLLGDGRT